MAKQKKELKLNLFKEPDPEEQEELPPESGDSGEEKIITDSLYNSIIQEQHGLEQNG